MLTSLEGWQLLSLELGGVAVLPWGQLFGGGSQVPALGVYMQSLGSEGVPHGRTHLPSSVGGAGLRVGALLAVWLWRGGPGGCTERRWAWREGGCWTGK